MNLTQKVINSAILAASAKVLSKVIGLVSTMVLARVLAPQEFGNIAIISIALYFFDILSHAASEQYIVQKTTVSRYELHTAWTVNIFLKLFVALVFILLSPSIATFFERPELTNAFRLSALILPIQALKSPTFILLKRQLNFAPLFWSSLAERLLAVPLLITLAIIFNSFWAFIVTDITANIFAVTISYCIAKKRPLFTLSHLKEQWSFSKWMLGKSIVGYMRSQCDTVVVSKFFPSGVLGNYHMARELAMMPAHFLLGPAIEPLLSAFKNDKDSLSDLQNNIAFSLITIVVIAIPVCFFVWQWSAEIVRILLGNGWSVASELWPVLMLLFLYWIVMQVTETALLAQGKVRLLFFLDCLTLVIITAGLLLVAYNSDSLADMAWTRAGIGILFCCVVLVLAFKGNFKHLLHILFFALATALMSSFWLYGVKFMQSILEIQNMNIIFSITFLVASLIILVVAATSIVVIGARVFNNYQAKRLMNIITTTVRECF